MQKATRPRTRSHKVLITSAAIAGVVLLLLSALIYFQPRLLRSSLFACHRVKNAFTYYVLKSAPQFYYLQMEKNGKDVRMGAGETLEITYRDEFVIKNLVSDDLAGKHTTATLEGTDSNKNQVGVLFRGLDLVNRIMQSDAMAKDTQAVNVYRIVVYFSKRKDRRHSDTYHDHAAGLAEIRQRVQQCQRTN